MYSKINIPLISVLTATFILTVFGAFFDLEIAKAVYFGEEFSENPFGIIFAFIGLIPTFVGWAFLGASILPFVKTQEMRTGKKRALVTLSVLLFVLSFFYFCNTLMMVNDRAFSVPWYLAYPVGIAIIALAAYGGYSLSKRSRREKLLEKLVFLAFVSIVTMIIIMATKGIMDRPRFRFVLEMQNDAYFRSFWQRGSDIKAGVSNGSLSDEFSSFPSGHSAYSMFAIFIFPALADYSPKLEKYKGALFALGFIWWVATAFSRLTVGAHYLTDVSLAGAVCIFSYSLVAAFKKIVLRERKN